MSSCGKSVALTSGNSANYGYILVDGNFVYYTKILTTDYGDFYSNIYRRNMNTGAEILIAEIEADTMYDLNAFLTLDGGYLYFLPNFAHDSASDSSHNIYRVKPNGKNTTPEALFREDIDCTFMHISNGIIFYYDDTESVLYRMKTDGTKRQPLVEAFIEGIAIGKDTIYYSEYEMLMSISVNGGEPVEVYDFDDYDFYIEHLILDGEYLFYLDDTQSRIGRIRIDGRDNRPSIYEYAYIEYFNVSNGQIYFVVDEYGSSGYYAIMSISPGSRNPRLVVSDRAELGYISTVALWGNSIYFIGMPSRETIMDSDELWFIAGTDGSGLTPFQPLNVYIEDEDDDD